MVDGKRRRGVGADVGLHGAIGNADAVGHVIDETVLVLEHADETPAHGPGLVERTRHVDLAALVGPRSERALETRLEIALRLLEPHVDRAGRLAIAAKQAGGTAQDLDVIDDGKIGLGAVDARQRRRQAIEIERVELEAAREQAGAAVVVVEHHDARRLAKRGVERGVASVLDALARHDGGRLRDLAHRKHVLLADTHQPRGVAVGIVRLVAGAFKRDPVEQHRVPILGKGRGNAPDGWNGRGKENAGQPGQRGP